MMYTVWASFTPRPQPSLVACSRLDANTNDWATLL